MGSDQFQEHRCSPKGNARRCESGDVWAAHERPRIRLEQAQGRRSFLLLFRPFQILCNDRITFNLFKWRAQS